MSTKSGPSPVAISQMLISVASSLSFKMEDQISIYHLILESRHFVLAMLNAMKFWTCSLIFVSLMQFITFLVSLPSFMSLGQIMMMTVVIIPALSLTLLGNKAIRKWIAACFLSSSQQYFPLK